MLHAVLVFILVRSKEKSTVVCRDEDSTAAAWHFRAVTSDHSVTSPPLRLLALQRLNLAPDLSVIALVDYATKYGPSNILNLHLAVSAGRIAFRQTYYPIQPAQPQ